MKYFARVTKQMWALDGILTFQFPWPKYWSSLSISLSVPFFLHSGMHWQIAFIFRT